MKIKCSGCHSEEIANDELRQLISEYELWRTPAGVRETIMKSFGTVKCPLCGCQIELVEGEYETFRDGSPFRKAGKRKKLQIMGRRTKQALKSGEVKESDIPKIGEKGMVKKFLKLADKNGEKADTP